MRLRETARRVSLLVVLSACGAASPADTSESPAPGPAAGGHPTVAAGGESIHDCEAPELLAVEVRSIVIAGRGTRSQAMDLRADVLASRSGSSGGTIEVASYVGGDVFMEEGGRYVVLLCGSDQVRGWDPLRSNDPAGEIAEIDLPGVPASRAGDAAGGSGDQGAPGARGAPVVVPTRYFIDGAEVDEAAFAELFDRLVVDADPLEAESVENSDGSYGGSGATYRARDGQAEYRYGVVNLREEDGQLSESRSISSHP